MNLSISPGKNNVGAYINDINLKSLDQDQAIEIKKILNQFGVIFIKEQNLDPETYQNFAKTIGQPVVYPRLKGLDEKFPFINVIERKPDDKNLRSYFLAIILAPVDFPVAPPPSQAICSFLLFSLIFCAKRFHNF